MHCTAIATLPPRCSSGVRITCWRSRRTRASCSLRPLGAMRAAEPAALPNGANPPLTIAASGGAPPSCAIPLSPRSRSSPASCAGPHHLAPPRAPCLCGASPGALLLLSKYIPAKQLLRIVRSHWDREPAALGTRCRLQQDRNRTRKDNAPENLAILRKLALNLSAVTPRHVPAPENQTRGGTTPSSWHAPSYAIAPTPHSLKDHARGPWARFDARGTWCDGSMRDSCRTLGVLPSPLWGGVGGGGRCWRTHLVKQQLPPSPPLPHKEGREQTAAAA